MLSSAQGLLIGVVIVLTTLLVVIGIQVVNILREIKKSLEKVNKMLDDAGVISGSAAEAISGLTNFLDGVKGGFKILELAFDFFKQRGKKQLSSEDNQALAEKTPEKNQPQIEPSSVKNHRSSVRHFFHRRGEKLN